MTQLLSSQGIDISQKNFQQIIIRGDGKDQFNEKINQEISTFPPSKNLLANSLPIPDVVPVIIMFKFFIKNKNSSA